MGAEVPEIASSLSSLCLRRRVVFAPAARERARMVSTQGARSQPAAPDAAHARRLSKNGATERQRRNLTPIPRRRCALFYEPNVRRGATAAKLRANVTVSGLTASREYVVFRYDSTAALPDGPPNGTGASHRTRFTAAGPTHTFEDGGYEFDVGIHYLGGEMDKFLSPTRRLFAAVSDGQLEWSKCDRDYDVCHNASTAESIAFCGEVATA